MDRQKTNTLERLVNEKITKHTATTAQTKDGKFVHLELVIKFRTDEELNAAIAQLQK